MKAEVTMSQVYHNPKTLMNFFFRTQAEETFEELMSKVTDTETALNRIDELFDDLDEVEEILYSESMKTIIMCFGLEDLIEDDDDEEEDEDGDE